MGVIFDEVNGHVVEDEPIAPATEDKTHAAPKESELEKMLHRELYRLKQRRYRVKAD